MGQFVWIVKIRSQNVHFHDSFWREQTLAAAKLFLSLTRMDFALTVSRFKQVIYRSSELQQCCVQIAFSWLPFRIGQLRSQV